jgi:tRNA1Val (adenine37-N6)-methyltransferase
MVAGDGETLDELRSFDLRIIQKRDGYRFSLDPLLLCEFVPTKDVDSAIDLGAGCGIIPLLLARRSAARFLVGLEQQLIMAELARRNAALNGLDGRIAVVVGNMCDTYRQFPVSSFDLVTANPPYRRRGTGRVSPKKSRDEARHESTATLADFLAVAKYLVKPGGAICLVHHPSRLKDLLVEADRLKLTPLRLCLVHGSEGAEARIFMIELAKGRRGELQVLPPLFVNCAAGASAPGSNPALHRKESMQN